MTKKITIKIDWEDIIVKSDEMKLGDMLHMTMKLVDSIVSSVPTVERKTAVVSKLADFLTWLIQEEWEE